MRRKLGGQKRRCFEGALLVERNLFAGAKKGGHSDRSLIFHVSILFS